MRDGKVFVIPDTTPKMNKILKSIHPLWKPNLTPKAQRSLQEAWSHLLTLTKRTKHHRIQNVGFRKVWKWLWNKNGFHILIPKNASIRSYYSALNYKYRVETQCSFECVNWHHRLMDVLTLSKGQWRKLSKPERSMKISHTMY